MLNAGISGEKTPPSPSASKNCSVSEDRAQGGVAGRHACKNPVYPAEQKNKIVRFPPHPPGSPGAPRKVLDNPRKVSCRVSTTGGCPLAYTEHRGTF